MRHDTVEKKTVVFKGGTITPVNDEGDECDTQTQQLTDS